MWPFKRKEKRESWTDTAINLYERQIAAREALGDKYLCHPKNDIPKMNINLPRVKFPLGYYQGYDVLHVPPGEVLQDATHYQDGTPILRVVK